MFYGRGGMAGKYLMAENYMANQSLVVFNELLIKSDYYTCMQYIFLQNASVSLFKNYDLNKMDTTRET